MLSFSLAPRKNEMIETLCTMLRIESVRSEGQSMMPYGKGIFDALMKMLGTADHLDFDSVNLFSRMGYVDFGEGDETVAVLTHLDVVPAGEGWTVPPFEGTVKDGRIYGRGAIDNKGPAVAALYALSALRENGVYPRKRIRLLFGCDEESGWSDIEYYKETVGQIPQFGISPDAEFPIINAEKGLVQVTITRDPHVLDLQNPRGAPLLMSFESGGPVNVVPAKATCVIKGQSEVIKKLADLHNEDARHDIKIDAEVDGKLVTLRATGVAAHGSKPEAGKNAAAELITFLSALPLAPSGPQALISDLAKNVGTEIDGKSMGIACLDRTGKLTVNLGYVHADRNVVEAGLDIRYPVTSAEEYIMEHVRERFTNCRVEKKFALPSHYVEEDGFLVKTLKNVYEEMTGEKAKCFSMGGATYARAFPNCVAYGPLFPGQPATEHQPDEYIEIDSLVKLADILAAAMYELSR